MGNFKIKSIGENKNTGGGSVPADLAQKVNQNETKINTIEQKYVKKDEANTFTAANTFNNQVAINSGANDFTGETTRNGNQNLDNTVARTKDFKYVRVFEKTTATTINDSGNTDLSGTLQGINTDGLHEFLIIVSIDNVAYSLNGKIVGKNGLGESKSQYLIISNGASECYFQLVIKGGDNFRIYHKKSGSAVSIQGIRGGIVRAGNQPGKMNQLG